MVSSPPPEFSQEVSVAIPESFRSVVSILESVDWKSPAFSSFDFQSPLHRDLPPPFCTTIIIFFKYIVFGCVRMSKFDCFISRSLHRTGYFLNWCQLHAHFGKNVKIQDPTFSRHLHFCSENRYFLYI